MGNENSFLGRGWSFPPSFGKGHGIRMVNEENDIAESLHIILSTSPGERLMNPEFGCDLKAMSFSTIDSRTINSMNDLIKDAILKFEPRISLEKVEIDTSGQLEGIIRIELYYLIRKVNIRTNLVYPFYFKEGTNIDLDYE
ncbi:GPW/gp25 family protein [Aureibacter tunicatorum]|uniref:IraD/Gp25-like domain-containing protein n=1 Tax=Aureibacter tunicatorum TaxID=866807 RepID=A0AAE4BUC9_9BACT|nr:GPW/gp25 family protein [Aureibacter tunicatorum]MDR6241661.1 hypothetical protein [Aureibacter tunicatorum]BDD07353.1 baseplate protein [Aureibacter tunicatorum]